MRWTRLFWTACSALACWSVLGAAADAGPWDQGANFILNHLIEIVVGAFGLAGAHQIAKRSQSPDVFSVWYATNRQFKDGQYTSEVGDALRFGICTVAIPKSHEIGSLGSSRIRRLYKRIWHGADDALDIIGQREHSQNYFLLSLGEQLKWPGANIFLYIHGYNQSFDSGILRAAQLGFDLKIVGVSTAFCWASRGDSLAYSADEDTIKLSEPALAEYLRLLHLHFPNYTINVLAHSMGNRAFLGILDNIHKYTGLDGIRFGQIFLAAPDIDARYFKLVSAVYSQFAKRTTLYVCSKDNALLTSEVLHRDQRTGYTPPVIVVNGIDTIDASNISLDALGHGYYAAAYGLLVDMINLLEYNAAPAARPGLTQSVNEDGSIYWSLPVTRG